MEDEKGKKKFDKWYTNKRGPRSNGNDGVLNTPMNGVFHTSQNFRTEASSSDAV